MAAKAKRVPRKTGTITPGDWRASDGVVLVDDPNMASDSSFIGVADCRTVDTAFEDQCANARLVAAAPDLLAACQEIAKQANMGIDATDPDAWDYAEITRPAIEAALAAIAKAAP